MQTGDLNVWSVQTASQRSPASDAASLPPNPLDGVRTVLIRCRILPVPFDMSSSGPLPRNTMCTERDWFVLFREHQRL